jgi:hypothetical protein
MRLQDDVARRSMVLTRGPIAPMCRSLQETGTDPNTRDRGPRGAGEHYCGTGSCVE